MIAPMRPRNHQGSPLRAGRGLRDRSGASPIFKQAARAHDCRMDITTDKNNDEGTHLLRRSRDGAMLAGVAAGLADYFDVDATLVRIGLVALSFLGGAGVPLYVAAWLLIPEEGSDVAVAGEILSHSWHR